MKLPIYRISDDKVTRWQGGKVTSYFYFTWIGVNSLTTINIKVAPLLRLMLLAVVTLSLDTLKVQQILARATEKTELL
jgi:hypothetical protein